ncbi:MAG: phosphate acyltransferase PlsX [Deltaproteobacteria bacterium]|nr:phosphate acyltransferase PlsX [Deltaproteobacteria bacterium]
MKIAVDAMGGDEAPEVVVQGALEAASKFGIHVILVGHEAQLNPLIDPRRANNLISIHHCEEVVGMEESPLKALRNKKDSSIGVAFGLLKEGLADAVISAGNSGATLAAGVLTLGRIPGLERPAIAGIVPTEKGPVILIDAGANVDCRPAQLFQFGVMAHAFGCSCLEMKNPEIALLNIGEEGSKGNELVRYAYDLFEKSTLNFVGNIEGRDLLTGDVKIVVCDGFVGNVALKLTEGTAESMARLMKRELMRSFMGRMAFVLGRKAFLRFSQELSYEEYGGAPLLGVKGIGIICHGGSSSKAICNAIQMAAQYAQNRTVEKMSLELKSYNLDQAL